MMRKLKSLKSNLSAELIDVHDEEAIRFSDPNASVRLED